MTPILEDYSEMFFIFSFRPILWFSVTVNRGLQKGSKIFLKFSTFLKVKMFEILTLNKLFITYYEKKYILFSGRIRIFLVDRIRRIRILQAREKSSTLVFSSIYFPREWFQIAMSAVVKGNG